MYDLQAYILLMKAVILVFGGLVTFYAVRAARRTGQDALWVLAIGISLVTIGSMTAGTPQLLRLDVNPWAGVVSTVSAMGFVVLAYSLYAGRSIPEE
ncbi:MAG: hypothetical protein ABEI31_04795 [Halodesulfurarchaeum sp.]